MLSNLLALMVGSGGLALIAGAFLAPKLYRNNDLIWGGVALFYGVVLWFCSTQIRGAVLLGDSAAVSLIGWLGWQAFLSRWNNLSAEEQAQFRDGSALNSQIKALRSGQTLPVPGSAPNRKSPPAMAPLTTPIAETIARSPEAIDSAKAAQAKVQDSVAQTVNQARAKVTTDRPAVTETLRKGLDQAQSAAPALLETITGAIGRLRDRLQGRKNPGRRYVRPEAPVTTDTTTYEDDWEEVVEEVVEDMAEELRSAAAPIVQEMDTVEEPVVEDPDKTVIEVYDSIEAVQEDVVDGGETEAAPVEPEASLPSPSETIAIPEAEAQPTAKAESDEDWDI